MIEDLKKALKVDLRVQVTVWDPEDDSVEHTFSSFIMEHVGPMLRIAPPTQDAKTIVPLMRKDYVVGIVMETNPAPFIFYPVIREDPKNPADGYWLTIPDNAEVEVFQRRRHVRIPMVVPFQVEFIFGSGDNTMTIPARTSDVSGGGMRFTSVRSFAKNTLIFIHLQFGEDQPMLHLNGKVIFSAENRTRKNPDDLFSTACQFVDIDDAKEMLLVRECFRCELKLKQNP